jgi:hypothetical protein
MQIGRVSFGMLKHPHPTLFMKLGTIKRARKACSGVIPVTSECFHFNSLKFIEQVGKNLPCHLFHCKCDVNIKSPVTSRQFQASPTVITYRCANES